MDIAMSDAAAATTLAPVGTTEKTGQGVPLGQESVASESKDTELAGSEASPSEKSSSESGPAEGSDARRKGTSPFSTIRDLRRQLREERSASDSRYQDLASQLEEMRSLIQTRVPQPKPSKTFWEAPEEIIEDRLTSSLSALEKRMMQKLEERAQVDQTSAAWKQETSEAAQFIQAKGFTDEDHEDIADLIRSTPEMQALSPMQRANYALYLFQQERGITDKSALKQKAHIPIGAPPRGGPKVWTDSEITQKVEEFERVPLKEWTPQMHTDFKSFEREVMSAKREGRVK